MAQAGFESRHSELPRAAPSSLSLPRRFDLYILSGVPSFAHAQSSEGERTKGAGTPAQMLTLASRSLQWVAHIS